MKLFRPQLICLTLIVTGMVLSGYLLWRHVFLESVGHGAGIDVCQALFGNGCDGILMSSAASRLGLPLAGWGLIYYATLAVLLLFGQFLGDAFEFEANVAALLLSLAALLLGLVLTGVMLAGTVPFCPLCALVHINNLALVVSLYRLAARPARELLQALTAGVRYLVTCSAVDPVQARWKLIGLFAVTLVAVVLYQRILMVTSPHLPPGGAAFNPKQIIAAFEANAPQDIPIGNNDPTLGPADAPVQIVVFSEFQCPACRRYASELHTFLKRHPAGLRVVFKHFPLNKACNPTMKQDLHPQACQAAYAAEAARRQGKFWPFHDKLFEGHLNADTNAFGLMARSLGLDLPRFEAERHDAATRARVDSDIALGTRLGVHGTPTLFLNRRRVPNIHPQAVQILLDHLLPTQGGKR